MELGQLIGIWAPCQGTGRTTITLAVAYSIAQFLKNKKVLVCCANGSNSSLIKAMGISPEETGIEDLVSFRLAGFTSTEYEKILERKGGIFFAGSSKMTPAFSQRFLTEFMNVFTELRDNFDMCIVDLPYGYDNTLCKALLARCDKVITVLKKDMESLKGMDNIGLLFNKNIFVINKYIYGDNSNSEYGNKDQFKQNNLYKVPFCEVLASMSNKGKLFQYFSLNTNFDAGIKNIMSAILGIEKNNLNADKTFPFNARLLGRLRINLVGGQQ